MKKFGLIVLLFFMIWDLISQTKDSIHIDSSRMTSAIIDHSDVQECIYWHAIFEKKKPFYEGYRIQIFSGNSKEDANRVKSEFYRKHPEMRCYLTYQQPYYKLRVGDYNDPQTAKIDVKRLVREYPSCFLVPNVVRRTGKETDKDD